MRAARKLNIAETVNLGRGFSRANLADKLWHDRAVAQISRVRADGLLARQFAPDGARVDHGQAVSVVLPRQTGWRNLAAVSGIDRGADHGDDIGCVRVADPASDMRERVALVDRQSEVKCVRDRERHVGAQCGWLPPPLRTPG